MYLPAEAHRDGHVKAGGVAALGLLRLIAFQCACLDNVLFRFLIVVIDYLLDLLYLFFVGHSLILSRTIRRAMSL